MSVNADSTWSQMVDILKNFSPETAGKEREFVYPQVKGGGRSALTVRKRA